MAEHTPGPWSRFDDGGATSNGTIYGQQFSDCVWGPLGPGHGLIADCSPSGQPASAETIANARLIAAAPDFLSAAAKLLAAFDELQGTTRVESILISRSDAELRRTSNEAIAELRAALEKAGG